MVVSPCSALRVYWKTVLLIVCPLLFAILPIIIPTDEAKCGYVMMVMAVFWMTEALPLAATALIPVFAFPFLGILQTEEVTQTYTKESVMMFFAGVTMAIAVEHSNLHKRIALFVILQLGQSPRRLMAGFMVTTMFLSMWISNTATTAMMVRVVDALLVELFTSTEMVEEISATSNHLELAGIENGAYIADVSDAGSERGSCKGRQGSIKSQLSYRREPKPQSVCDLSLSDESRALKDMCFLAVAYSADIGGTGSMTGCGANLVLKGILSSSFSEPTGLNFGTWMAFNIPGTLACTFLTWVWLQFLFIGFCKKNTEDSSPEKEAALRKIVANQYRDLGPMTHHETTVFSLFFLLVMIWVFRSPEFVPGWSSLVARLFGENFQIKEASPGFFMIVLLFCLPAKLDFLNIRKQNGKIPEPSPGCLTWKVVHEKMPWGIILLMGGGIALAEGSNKSGLSNWMGEQLTVFQALPKELNVTLVTFLICMLTEVTSNTATASIFLPVLREMALRINVNPLYMMLPATICCSYAFIFPVANPPNAIVFSAANMRSTDMIKAGIPTKIMCFIVITIMINTIGIPMFDLHSMPAWANSTLATQ